MIEKAGRGDLNIIPRLSTTVACRSLHRTIETQVTPENSMLATMPAGRSHMKARHDGSESRTQRSEGKYSTTLEEKLMPGIGTCPERKLMNQRYRYRTQISIDMLTSLHLWEQKNLQRRGKSARSVKLQVWSLVDDWKNISHSKRT